MEKHAVAVLRDQSGMGDLNLNAPSSMADPASSGCSLSVCCNCRRRSAFIEEQDLRQFNLLKFGVRKSTTKWREIEKAREGNAEREKLYLRSWTRAQERAFWLYTGM